MRRSGARNFDFDIDTGRGSLHPAEGLPVDFAAIRAAVDEAGFELLALGARVRGRLQSSSDRSGRARPSILVEETGQVFWLVEGKTDQEHEGYARLEEWMDGPGKIVVVRGRVHGHQDLGPGLSVEEFRVLGGRPAP